MGSNSAQPPVIIIGMHRSGTSMVARILEELGLFWGRTKEKNHEARLFRLLNDWLLRYSGSTWDYPEPTQNLLDNAYARALAVDYIRHLMESSLSISYLGWSGYLRYHTPANLDLAWGWKDPRNTYTLPLWLDLFPEAKVIHIYRNGADVAGSLRARSKQELVEVEGWMEQRKQRWILIRRFFPNWLVSLRCLSLSEGFALWEAYTQRADDCIASLPVDKAIAFRYEDFLEDPAQFIGELCQFSGLDPNPERVGAVQSKIDPARSKVYERDPELFEFYESVKNSPQMIRYSY